MSVRIESSEMYLYKVTTSIFGNKCWYLNEELHSLDGPSVEYYDGRKE